MGKSEQSEGRVGFEEIKDDLVFELFEDEGREAEGFLAGYRQFKSQDGGHYTCLILKTKEDRQLAIPVCVKLSNFLDKFAEGDYILIKFKGYKRPDGKRPFKDFQVFKAKDPGSINLSER